MIVWDLRSGQQRLRFPCAASVLSVAISPERPYVVVAGLGNGQVLFFRLEGI